MSHAKHNSVPSLPVMVLLPFLKPLSPWRNVQGAGSMAGRAGLAWLLILVSVPDGPAFDPRWETLSPERKYLFLMLEASCQE